VARLLLDLDPLVVVVDRDRDRPLGLLLADHVAVEIALDLRGRGHVADLFRKSNIRGRLEKVVAELDALVADVRLVARKEPFRLAGRLAAK